MDANQICICVGVKDTSSEFLQYLDRQNIALGKTIIIKSKESFDNSMVIEVNNAELMISNKIANNILVKKQ